LRLSSGQIVVFLKRQIGKPISFEKEIIMRLRALTFMALFLTLGCSTGNQAPTVPGPMPASRSYHGTASVGDFMNITIDTTAKTISYTNVTNGDAGTVPYTLNSDGSYALNDPTGNLLAAYEIPGYAMLIEAQKSGSDHATPALITAVAQTTVTLGTFQGHGYNYMQFRTAAGGFESGSAIIDAQGNVSISSYWPYGASMQGSPFNNNTMLATNFSEDTSGTFLRLADSGGGSDYVFGTGQGFFIVDTANGAILGMKKAGSKNFDPTVAGTYHSMYYQKTNASTGQGNVESGTASLGSATITIDAQSNITVQDSQGNTVVQTTLTPVADTAYLYGSSGQLSDPCFGLFTFRVTTANSQQDVFVTFLGRAVLFSSFTTPLPLQQGNTYAYLYGVGLK
jgi:hypothetical protein